MKKERIAERGRQANLRERELLESNYRRLTAERAEAIRRDPSAAQRLPVIPRPAHMMLQAPAATAVTQAENLDPAGTTYAVRLAAMEE